MATTKESYLGISFAIFLLLPFYDGWTDAKPVYLLGKCIETVKSVSCDPSSYILSLNVYVGDSTDLLRFSNLNPLSQVVFFHPFPHRRRGVGY